MILWPHRNKLANALAFASEKCWEYYPLLSIIDGFWYFYLYTNNYNLLLMQIHVMLYKYNIKTVNIDFSVLNLSKRHLSFARVLINPSTFSRNFRHPSITSKAEKAEDSLSRILLNSSNWAKALSPRVLHAFPLRNGTRKTGLGNGCVLRQEPSEATLKMQSSRVDTVMLIRIHFGRIGKSRRRLKCTCVEERRLS